MVAAPRQQRGRGLPGERPQLARQMRLIGIAGGGGEPRATRRRSRPAARQRQQALQPHDPLERLRSIADRRREAPMQAPLPISRRRASVATRAVGWRASQRVAAGPPIRRAGAAEAPDQGGLDGRLPGRDRGLFADPVGGLGGAATPDLHERGVAVEKLARRYAEHARHRTGRRRRPTTTVPGASGTTTGRAPAPRPPAARRRSTPGRRSRRAARDGGAAAARADHLRPDAQHVIRQAAGGKRSR